MDAYREGRPTQVTRTEDERISISNVAQ
jgi:hypothetical protein